MRIAIGDRLQDGTQTVWQVTDVWTGGATLKASDGGVQLLSHQELRKFIKGRD